MKHNTTWKQAKIHQIEIQFECCIEGFKGFKDDRLVYINTYNQIMEALNELPENPVTYIRVAMWRQINKDMDMLRRIQAAFCD